MCGALLASCACYNVTYMQVIMLKLLAMAVWACINAASPSCKHLMSCRHSIIQQGCCGCWSSGCYVSAKVELGCATPSCF